MSPNKATEKFKAPPKPESEATKRRVKGSQMEKLKKLILWLMMWFNILLAALAGAAPPSAIPDQYVIVLKAGGDVGRLAQEHGLGIEKQFRHAINGFSTKLNAGQMEKLKKHPSVLLVEPDLRVQALTQAVPTGIQRIQGAVSNDNSIVDIDVAVIDTGVDATHPDLNVVNAVNFSSSPTAGDNNGHSTHVAGIIAARDNDIGVVGVVPGARIWSVKVLDDSGSGSLSGIIAGVDYVTQHASQIPVANMSLGGSGVADSLRLAIQNSVSKGVVYVVAAGNSSFEVLGSDLQLGTWDDFFPAAYPEVMTVSALVDTDGKTGGIGPTNSYGPDDSLATFSNFSTTLLPGNPVNSPGALIDVAAPGVDIYSTYKGGAYATMSGTSMASPHVAGAVALYIAAYGRAYDAAGVYRIRQAIIDHAQAQVLWGKNKTTPYSVDQMPEGLLQVGWIPVVRTNITAVPVPTPTPTPTPTPAPSVPLTVSVSSDKSTYKLKEKAVISVVATTNTIGIGGVMLNIDIASATGRLTTLTGTTTAGGVYSFTYNLSKPGGVGIYTIHVLGSKAGLVSAEGGGSFLVR